MGNNAINAKPEKAKNLILTPHIGFVSEEAYEKFFNGYLKAIEAFINKNPTNQIS